MGLFKHRAKDSRLLCLELHFKALLLGLEFVGKYFCGIFITASSLKMFLHCGMLVLFWYFSSEFGFSAGIHFGCHMEIFRTKKLFIQPTEAVEGFSLRSSRVRVFSTALAHSVQLNLWYLQLLVPATPPSLRILLLCSLWLLYLLGIYCFFSFSCWG